MYNPGADYLSYKEHNTAIRKPRSKIVVDGVTYTGLEHLVTYPKITHETDKMIGGFPAKTCEFEIYNLDGNLNLNGKEVQVYRGLDISDEKTVWVPMGLFYADGDDVVNNSTKRTIQFKGTDRTRLFDSPFKNVYANGVVPMYTDLANIVIKICAAHKLTIDPSTEKNILSYALKNDAGTPEGTTDRQVIAWIAELSGCIPIISRDGNYLVFTRPKYTERVSISGNVYSTGSYAQKARYKSLTAEPKFGAINSISFGHADYDDAYVYQDESVGEDSICEWPINDNAFAENEKKDIAPLVYAKIKGMSIIPFTLTDFIDDYLFDINDGILVQKKDGTTFNSYVLGMSTSSRIRSGFKAGTQDTTAADRSLAGSVKNDIKKVKLSVDHVNNEITALAQDTNNKYAELKLTCEGIDSKIEDPEKGLKAQLTATAEKATAAYSKAETVKGQVDGVTTQIESIKNELSGLDDTIANKVTTEVQKDTTIEILAGKVNSQISGKYVTKTDYDDEKKNWVLLTDYNSRLEQTDQNITASVNRIQTLENAGYITQDTAESLISAQADNITLSVEKNLKIGARNILLDSACFAGLPVAGRTSTIPTITLYDDTAVPSGAFKDIVFSPLSTNLNDDGTCANPRGFYFTSSNLIGQKYSEAEYTLTSDTEVNEYKRYYTRSGSEGSYVYSYVESPTKDDLATYYELTQEAQRIDKIKPNTTYALSWWMRWGYSLDKPNDFQFNDVLYFGAYNYAKYNSDKCIFPGLSTAWQRYVIVFTTPAKITDFWLRFFFASVSPEIKYSVHISSFKLEEGNIATDWTPSAEDIDQSVKAQIDLCVKTDENGKLVSEILIESNKLRIDTDNFTLDGNGNMTCVNAEMSNVTISGVVTANNAVLGGWHIADNELYSECGSCTAHIKAPQSSSEYFFAVRESLGDNKYTSNFAINTDGSVFMNNLVAAETGITIKTYSSKEKKYVENIKICGTIQSYPTSNCYYDTIMANHDLCIETGYDKIMRLYANKIYLCNRVILTEYQSGTKGKAALYVDTNTGEITVESS